MAAPLLAPLALAAALGAGSLAPSAPADSTNSPEAAVRAALAAVEGDSVAPVRDLWTARLRRDPRDRAAALSLASLARLTYDYPLAERHYRQLVGAGAATPDGFAAYARLGQAHGLAARSAATAATRAYEEARTLARAAGAPVVEVEALVWLASQRQGAGKRAALDSAAAMVAPDDLERRAMILCQRAAQLRDRGWASAAADGDSGVALARRSGSRTLEGRCLAMRAWVQQDRGDVDSALAVLRLASAALADARDVAERATALRRLGQMLQQLGYLGPAKDTLNAAIALAEAAGDPVRASEPLLNLVSVSINLNDLLAADDYLRRARAAIAAARRSGRLEDGDARAAVELIDAYEGLVARWAGDAARARPLLDAAAGRFASSGRVRNETTARVSLAYVAMQERDWARAERELRIVGTLAREHDMPAVLGELPTHEAKLALLRGDFPAAERGYTAFLGTLSPGQHGFRYGTRARLAEVYAARGDLARAERELVAANDELDAWRATMEDPELRLLASELCACGDQNDGVPRVLAALAAGGRVESAFALAERRRARDLVNRMMQAEVLRASGARETSPGELRARVRRQARPATASEIAAALPAGTALLEFVTGPGDTPATVFVVTRMGIRTARLAPSDSIAARVSRFVALLESGADAGELGRTLGAMLLDPLLPVLGPEISHLVIVPAGALHRLPFDALRLPDGRFVVERFATGAAPSAAVARELWRRRDRRAGGAGQPLRLLAFGDPAFGGETASGQAGAGSATAETFRSLFDSAGGLPRLRASAREVRTVASFAPEAEIRIRERASAAFLRSAPLSGYRVLHFATHALVDDRTAARTALALAPAEGDDGFVTPGDLAALRLNADLVVLSACRTAGGRIIAGEGVQGLTAPLLQAGARAVMATGWRIGDRSTVPFVESVYAGLARGLPVSDALRAAKLAAIRRGAPPAEWAAFSVIGDPFVTVPLREPAPTRWWYVAATGAAALLGLAVLARRRRRRRA